MSITRHFKLGLNAGASLPLLIHANQYDRGEEWAFTLYNQDGSKYIPSSGAIIGIKSDKLGISLPGRVEGDEVIITESQQMTAAAGKAVFELLIDGETHGTANFVVLVEPRPGDGAVVSASDYSLFQEAINSITIAGSGAPAVATLASQMTDEGKVYLYAGSETGYTKGDWYYYNGSAWTDGGKYGGTVDSTLTISGAAADAKKTGDEISELKSEISDIEEQIESGASGLTVRIKHALMQLANYVAFKNNDPNAQEYIDELYDSLFEITGIRLNSSSLSFTSLGATQQLTATTTPEGGDVVWTSSDTSIATVDQTGLVTSVAYGSATITATSGSVSATCSVVIATATVTSLSAVYSPSGNVYEGASLDSLKSDLVVTAHWSNGTITAVDDADYSLSGTLVEGANTITVSYGGQTATFNVTVSPVPVYGTFTPDNYVQGYYIESDGTVTASQYGSMSNTYYDVARGVLNFAASANFRVSLYDANKNFIRQVIFTDSGTTGNGAIRSHDAAITFTDDVKYFRLSWSKTTNVEFTITNVEYTDLHMEIGDIDTTTGEDVVQPLRIRSVDYIPVSSTSLVLNNYKPFLDSEFMNSYGFLGRCYDSSKTLVGNISWTTTNKTITLPTGTAFIRPIIQFGNVNIPDDFADYQYIPLLLNSANYRIVKA